MVHRQLMYASYSAHGSMLTNKQTTSSLFLYHHLQINNISNYGYYSIPL